jgi:hypothetical protein
MMMLITGQIIFAQRAGEKGNIFRKRLALATGIDYSTEEENAPATAGIIFSPQFFLTTSYSDFSVSVAGDATANYRLDNTQDEFSKKIFFQLPVLVNANFGHGASKDFYNPLGFFIGAGWNVQHSGDKTDNGFAADAGIRLWMFGQSLTLKFIYFPGDEKIFSSGKIISLQFSLGKYLSDVKRNNKVSNFMKPYKN